MNTTRALLRTKQILGVLLGAAAVVMIASILHVSALGPAAREAREFFRRMPLDRIESVVIEPVPKGLRPLSGEIVVITRAHEIRSIATLVSAARPWRANHPDTEWTMALRFQLRDRAFSGRVVSTTNQGVLFYYGLGTDGGPVYGTYREDELGPLLQAIVAQRNP